MNKLDPTVIKIDDVLRGYNDSNKLRDVYSRIRKEVLTSEPTQSSNVPLITLKHPNWRDGSYGWELYDQEGTLCMIEYFNRSDGYSNARDLPKDLRQSTLSHLHLTLHKDDGKLKASIEDILKDFPRESSKKEEAA